MKSTFSFTALIEKSDDGWYVGQIQEVPEALSQGKTIDELLDNLNDALQLVFDTNKKMLQKENTGKKMIKRKLVVS